MCFLLQSTTSKLYCLLTYSGREMCVPLQLRKRCIKTRGENLPLQPMRSSETDECNFIVSSYEKTKLGHKESVDLKLLFFLKAAFIK